MPDTTRPGFRAPLATLGGLCLALLAAGCSTTGRAPTDTGSMALPAPRATGVLGTTGTTGTATAPQPRDTGNMAYPAPLPQGNIGTTRVR